jgi:hypothetical protein
MDNPSPTTQPHRFEITFEPGPKSCVGSSATRTHQTIRFQGGEDPLDALGRVELGVSVAQIKQASAH